MTINEILNGEILLVHEDEKNYYVLLKPDYVYDDTVWKVDKNTKTVEFASYVSDVVLRGLESIDIAKFKNSMM